MDPQSTIDFSREALTMVAIVGGPILVAGLIIGLIVGIFQAMTQIQDQTVSAVPKILGMLLVTIMVLPWIGDRMVEYTRETLSTPRMDGIGGIAPVAAAEPSPFKFASATTRLMPDVPGGPVARIAANRPGLVVRALQTTMPTMKPKTTSMPIHPYGQSPVAPAANRSSMPQLQLQNRNLPQQPVKNIDL